MINEVDESLRNLVNTEIINGADVDVLFDAPTRDWAARRNTPTVDLYLYDIREDLRRRETGMIDVRDEHGLVVERRPAPRYFKLAYLITAWTQRPEDEHRLLSAILACFLRHDVLPDASLTPLLRELETPLNVMIAYPPPENRQVSDVWTSLGGDLKPSIDLVITIPLQPDLLFEIAQAVMSPLRLKAVGHTTYDVEDDVRHLRDAAPVQPAPAGRATAESSTAEPATAESSTAEPATAESSTAEPATAESTARPEPAAAKAAPAKPRPRKSSRNPGS
jgi:hypothetical protein